MLQLYADITLHIASAAFAGALIGMERSFHGRPAGFRTHTLVCMASALLMLVTLYQANWFSPTNSESLSIDPTRMAQGIMTGIGFLGAGVIFREGLSVRGLTTAASIWITSAIGVLFGVGFFFAASLATALTLGVLSLFRVIESRIPAYLFAHHQVRFARDAVMPEEQLRRLLEQHGFTVAQLSYRLDSDGPVFEYRMMIRTRDSENMRRLAHTLAATSEVLAFRITPAGD